MITKRLDWVDCVKGISIILIMFGHIETHTTLFKGFISMFHVQVFLVISGYLFAKNNKNSNSIKSIIKKICIPYVIFSILAIIFDIIFCVFDSQSIIKTTLIDVYKTLTLFGILAIWYLPSYTIASSLFLILKDKVKANLRWVIIAFLIVISVVFSYLFNYIHGIINSFYYDLIYFPVAAIVRSLVCVFYIAIGFELGAKEYIERIPNYYRVIIAILLLILTATCSVISNDRNFSMLEFGNYPFILLLGALTGALGVIFLLFKCDCKYMKPIMFLGKNSLIILVTHMTFKLTNLSRYIVSMFVDDNNPFYSLISFAFLLMMEVPIIFLFNGPLKFCISGKSLREKD